MKKYFLLLSLFVSTLSLAQMGQVWPVDQRQDFDVDSDLKVSKTYDPVAVCQFFMFINNNEFIHVTDGMTSLYKIISRDESVPNEPMYTVVSEAGNTYTYIFNQATKQITCFSAKGFAIAFICITPHDTKVFSNINR